MLSVAKVSVLVKQSWAPTVVISGGGYLQQAAGQRPGDHLACPATNWAWY